MNLTSTAFEPAQSLPLRSSKEGDNLSPPLLWQALPTDTRALALLCEDPDAPRTAGKEHPFVHWVLYNLSPDAGLLPEGVPQGETLAGPVACKQGRNSFGSVGYDGPRPPVGHGPHRYVFRLFALSCPLHFDGAPGKAELLAAIADVTLGAAELVGTY